MRSLTLAFAIWLAPVASAATEPSLVLQVQPIERLLEVARQGLRQAGGELFVTLFNTSLNQLISPKGFDGLDVKRPWGISAVLQGAMQDYNFVVVLPITNEAAFFDLLKRFGARAFPESGAAPNTVRLPPIRTPDFEIPIFARCKGDHAFVAFGSADALSDAKLPDPRTIVPDGPTPISLRIRMDRLGMPIKKTLQLGFEMMFWDEAPSDPLGRDLHAIFAQMRPRWYQMGFQEPREWRFDGDFDPQSGLFSLRARLTGKPDTLLTRSVKERSPSTNTFAGVVNPDTAISLLGQLPQFDAQLSTILTRWLHAWAEAQPPGTPLAEILHALGRSVERGNADFALQLRGPNGQGFSTMLFALNLRDTRWLEASVQKQNALPGWRINAFRAGNIPVHQVDLSGWQLPKIMRDALGEPKSALLAFGPNAGYIAIGPDALINLQSATIAKPGPAAAIEARAFPKPLTAVLEKVAPDRGLTIASLQRFQKVPSIDLFRLEIEGGEALTITFRVGYLLWLAAVE